MDRVIRRLKEGGKNPAQSGHHFCFNFLHDKEITGSLLFPLPVVKLAIRQEEAGMYLFNISRFKWDQKNIRVSEQQEVNPFLSASIGLC